MVNNQYLFFPVYKELVINHGCMRLDPPEHDPIDFDDKINGKSLEELTLNQIAWFDGNNTIRCYNSSKIDWEICARAHFVPPPINLYYLTFAGTKAFYNYIIYNIPNCKRSEVQKLSNKNISYETSDLLSHLFTWYDIIHDASYNRDIKKQILVFNLLLKNETKEFQMRFHSLKDKNIVDLINNV